MKSALPKLNNIHFNSELNTLLGFTNTDNSEGTHKSEIRVMITTTDKVHLKCDCVDGSIVNDKREQNLLRFFFLVLLRDKKSIKEPNIILYKKINKTRLDKIQFFLQDNNHNRVDFNRETLTLSIHPFKM